MASLPLSAATPHLHLTLPFRFPAIPSNSISIPILRITSTSSHSSSAFRCKGTRRRLQIDQRLLFAVCATNPNSKGGNLPNEGSDVKETSSQGPPLLTILAGLLVFLTICWIFGSIILWLLSFIVNLPPK